MVKNILRNFDFISPKITLFYEGNRRYSTIIGGIFTLLIILTGVCCFINQILLFANYDINGIVYYRKYLDNLGTYEFNNNKNSIFIFANFFDFSIKNKYIDLSKIRLIGTFPSSSNINNESFFEKDHWLFDNCSSINLESELIKLSEKNLKSAVCIKYYYNANEKRYYSINDKNFKTPELKKSSQTFNIYVYKCVNNSITNQIYGNCSSESEVIDYIDNQIYLIKLSFLSHQIDSNDNKNPDQLYINSINSRIRMSSTYSYNTITFSPLIIERDIGIIFHNTITEKLYTYQEYKKGSQENLETEDILNLFYIMFESVSHSYKYSYKTIYDLFAKLTIIIRIVYNILFILNYIFNLFIANINIQNVIFHKIFTRDNKAIHSFSENYKFNLGNKSIKTIKNRTINIDNRNIIKDSNKNDVSKIGLISKKDSIIQPNENINNNQNNNKKDKKINNIHRKNNNDVRKIQVEDKKFGNMVFTKKDILLFFKYLIFKKWNNSPLLLLDSMQKKLLSVEHLFQIHLLLLYIKKNDRETNLLNNYKFFYE